MIGMSSDTLFSRIFLDKNVFRLFSQVSKPRYDGVDYLGSLVITTATDNRPSSTFRSSAEHQLVAKGRYATFPQIGSLFPHMVVANEPLAGTR